MSIKTPWVDKRLMCENARSLSELKAVGPWIIWVEKAVFNSKRRSVLMGRLLKGGSLSAPEILTPKDSEVGSQVHEYGGGSWTGWIDSNNQLNLVYVDPKRGGVFHYVDNKEKQIASSEGKKGEKLFFADFDYSLKNNSIVCVRESRFSDGSEKSALLKICLNNAEQKVLEDKADFYASPRQSPGGTKLAWIEWNDPFMPWDASTLKIKAFKDSSTSSPSLSKEVHCTTEPHWQGESLWFLSDFDGLMRPVKLTGGKTSLLPALGLEAGLPLWQLDQNTYLPLQDDKLLIRVSNQGRNRLKIYDHNWKDIEDIYPVFAPVLLADGSYAVLNAPEDAPAEIIHFNLDKEDQVLSRQTVRLSNENWTKAQSEKVSEPRFLEIPIEGNQKNKISALYYAPVIAQEASNAPMLVRVHGGPTAQCSAAFDMDVQFWTARGFAVLDVNYRGSTGAGVEFRNALNQNWGVVDVEDCIEACKYAVAQGLAAADKCFIRGSSAGGFTVFTALAEAPGVFRAGCARYGVSDLADLVHSSHRFEAHYTDQLIAPFDKQRDVYEQRSPINWAEKIKSPVLLLHGKKDRVVPFQQTLKLAEKLARHELHLYEEEGHGFRVPETRFDALVREYDFYQNVLASK